MIGLGHMAEALIGGVILSHVLPTSCFVGTDVSPSRRDVFAGRFGIKVGEDNKEAVTWANTILLAVKPQTLGVVLAEIGPHVSGKLLISIAAGIPIRWIADRVHPEARIIRVMPNAPALIGKGMSVMSCATQVMEEEADFTRSIFAAVGKTVALEEALMDGVTGLSGSGPAYAYMAIEALADGGVKMGLPRPIAETLAAHTLVGASTMVLESAVAHGSFLKEDRVLHGATAAGVEQVNQLGVGESLASGVAAAARRSAELGRTCS